MYAAGGFFKGLSAETLNSTQVGQGRIRDRTHERLGRNDAKVLLLRKLWRRELTALADGRPVADWQIPARPFGRLAAVPASLGGAR